ncbi:hypothetical protein Tco_0199731 [Tanacetum coccineum]
MVAYLKKPIRSEGFQEIVYFLNGSHIRYALTKNPTIYVSLIEKFWQTATVRTVDNREQEITATVDGKEFTITEASVRRHLQLSDVDVNTASTSITTASINITTAEPVTTASAPITTAGVSVIRLNKYTSVPTTISIEDEDLAIAQTLMKTRSMKSIEKSKEKGVSSETATTTTTRGVTMQEPSESGIRKIVPPPQHDPKDKGKAKMIELESPLKKKDHIKFDEEMAKRLTEELQAELEEEERVARQREEEANLIS